MGIGENARNHWDSNTWPRVPESYPWPFTTQSQLLTTIRKTAEENFVEKGENALNQWDSNT